MAGYQESEGRSDHNKLRMVYRNCIVGSHILHYNGVLDAYGHLSARHPYKPDLFIMPRNTAPANVTSYKDLVQYHVSDGSSVDPNAPAGYLERYIHSEIYKLYPEVNGIVHSHAPEVIPYTVTTVPLRPCIHMAGFLGKRLPIFDISKHYASDDVRDLLIRNVRLGAQLAEYLSQSDFEDMPGGGTSSHPLVLMRGHGYTIVGSGPEEAIYRAIYTKQNAGIQTISLGLARSNGPPTSDVEYLKDDELIGTMKMSRSGWVRAWGLWLREVEATDLYRCSEEWSEAIM